MRVEITSHIYDIPRRLREATNDPNIRVFFNSVTEKFDVMGVDLAFTPYVICSFDRLDARTERVIAEAYAEAHRTGKPYAPILRHLAEKEYREEQQYWASLYEKEYVIQDTMRYCDTPVVTPGVDLNVNASIVN